MTSDSNTTTNLSQMPRWKCWWLAARPRTLTASLVPTLVGLSIAVPRSAMDAAVAAATIASALAIQVGVNFANDCFDAEAGIDTEARLGPMRAVQAGLVTPTEMRRAFYLTLVIAVAFGLPLVIRGGLPILAVGVVSMICAWAYAGGPKPLASLGLGDLFVFVFFGIVPVAGTVWLQRLSLDPSVFLAAVPVALLAVAILVVNNLRDIATDSVAGKRTLAVRLGDAATRTQYALCVAVAMLWPVLLAPFFGAPVLLVWLALPVAGRAVADVRIGRGAELNESLAATAKLQLLHGGLLAAGILLSARSF